MYNSRKNNIYNLVKLADNNRSAGFTDYAKALWWKFNDGQFRDAASRMQQATNNLSNADPNQLRRDAATLNKLRNNPVTWRYIQNQAKNNGSNQFKTFVDRSDIISRWADPRNRDIEKIQGVIKGLNPMTFLRADSRKNINSLNTANELLANDSPYAKAIPAHYRSLWGVANPIYSGIARAKQFFNNRSQTMES